MGIYQLNQSGSSAASDSDRAVLPKVNSATRRMPFLRPHPISVTIKSYNPIGGCGARNRKLSFWNTVTKLSGQAINFALTPIFPEPSAIFCRTSKERSDDDSIQF